MSTSGFLSAAPVNEVRGCIEQLLGLGLLQQAGDEYSVLRLTTEGLALPRDEKAPGSDPGASKRTQERSADAESWQGSIGRSSIGSIRFDLK